MLEQLAWLRATVDQLVLQAAKGGSPRLYAEVTLDNLPAGVTSELLLQFIGAEDWWSKLQGLDARVKPYEQWFVAYRSCVLRLLNRRKDRETKQANGLSQAPTPEPPLPDVNQPTTEIEYES